MPLSNRGLSANHVEDPLDPEQLIVDAHHHLYDRPQLRYLLDEFIADLGTGHNIRATVLVQALGAYRPSRPKEMRPVGETEFAVRLAAIAASLPNLDVNVCAGIVGYADLLLGDLVKPVLEAHIRAAGGTGSDGGSFRGIRHIAAWDPDPALLNPAYPTTEDMLESPRFRAGFAHLAPLGLSFDAWILFPQLPKLVALAREFPDTSIVLDHCGGIVGVGPYAGRQDEVFQHWSKGLRELAHCPNVMVKLSGLGMPLSGLGFDDRACGPSSEDLATCWRPWFETCIDAFGSARCMFASNFPADKTSHAYGVGWNAMKLVMSGASAQERDDLFWRSAARFYSLSDIGPTEQR